MNFLERQNAYGPILRAAFELEGLPGSWGCAIARRESLFRPDTEVLTGGDGRRGGSFGLCCVSMKTAHDELGYAGDADGLKSAPTNATLAAKYCALLSQRHKTDDLHDIAALYNSGRLYDHAPESTHAYVKDVVTFAQFYEVHLWMI